jgi:hypothetical protein
LQLGKQGHLAFASAPLETDSGHQMTIETQCRELRGEELASFRQQSTELVKALVTLNEVLDRKDNGSRTRVSRPSEALSGALTAMGTLSAGSNKTRSSAHVLAGLDEGARAR